MFQALSEPLNSFNSYIDPNILREENKVLSNETEAETFHLINECHQNLCLSLISLPVQCIYLK